MAEKVSMDVFADSENFFEALMAAKKSYESIIYIFKNALDDFEKSIYSEEVKKWGKKDKLAYLESASRFAFAGSNPWISERMRQEHLRIDRNLSQHKTEVHDLMFQNNARVLAFEINSNSAGMACDLPKRIKSAAEKYLADGDKEAVETLVNPCHLKPGTEVLWYDEEKKEIIVEPLADMQIEGTEGLAVLGEEVLELEEINQKLIGGDLMLKNGDNMLGGVESLKSEVKYDFFSPGSVLTIDVTSPFERGNSVKTSEVKVLKNNFAELEEKYGLAFLKFINYAPKGHPLAVVDLQSEDGHVAKDWDVRDLKIVSKE